MKGFLPEMQELPGCFCPLGSWLVFSVQVLLCREMININYELSGHWKLLVLGVSAWYLHRNETEPESRSWSRKIEDNVSKNIFRGVSFAFSPRADPLCFHHSPATAAFIKTELVLCSLLITSHLPRGEWEFSMLGEQQSPELVPGWVHPHPTSEDRTSLGRGLSSSSSPGEAEGKKPRVSREGLDVEWDIGE